MSSGVSLYATYLFGNCLQSTIIRRFNNAPGLSAPGAGGIDSDAAGRIGYKDMGTEARVAGSNKGRIQGICCGITAGWVAAFLGGNSAARNHDEFRDFFMGPLRFQGAYAKDKKGDFSTIPLILKAFGMHNSNPSGVAEALAPGNIASSLPDAPVWAAYLSAYRHAIGIGYQSYRYFVMEPNGGLFEYRNRGKFVDDLRGFLLARAKADPSPSMRGYFYVAG